MNIMHNFWQFDPEVAYNPVAYKQVCIHEISRSPARLCPPTKALPTDQPTDQRTDTPSYRVVAHD